MTTKKARILSIEKAVHILNLFKNSEKLTLNEITERMDIPKTTAFGIIATLENLNMLKFDCITGKYILGDNILELSNSMKSSLNLKEAAVRVLRDISDQYNLNAHITMLSGKDILYVESIVPHGIMTVTTVIGAMAPANCTSSGKAFLANLSEDELALILEDGTLRGLTPNSITSPCDLKEELKSIRDRGYAIDNEESILGVKGVGTVVMSHLKKPVLGISIAGLLSYMNDANMEIYAGELKTAAQYLSKKCMGKL